MALDIFVVFTPHAMRQISPRGVGYNWRTILTYLWHFLGNSDRVIDDRIITKHRGLVVYAIVLVSSFEPVRIIRLLKGWQLRHLRPPTVQ